MDQLAIIDSPQAIAPQRVEALIEQFIGSQDVKPSSKALYKRTLKLYFSWVKQTSRDLSQITREDVIHYKQDLLDQGMSSLTAGSYITVVRKFYEWAEAYKYYPNVARGVKSPKRKQQFRKQALTEDQSKGLLHYFETRALRDYAIVNLLIRTGLRTVEVIRANVEDITYKEGKRVLLVHGKGRDEKDDFVVITDKAYEPITHYLETRSGAKAGEPLFTSTSNNSKGERLTTRTISSIAKEGLKAIGLNGKEFTAHSLRHTTGVSIILAGGSLEDAQRVLRHSSPATTQIYTATIKERMRLQHSAEELIDNMY